MTQFSDPWVPPDRFWLFKAAVWLAVAYIIFKMPFVAHRSADGSYLHFFSVDEYSFAPRVVEFAQALKQQDWSTLLNFELNWTYGYLFYWIYGIALLPFDLTDPYGSPLIVGRTLGLLFSAGTIVVTAMLSYELSNGRRYISFCVAFTVALMPGLLVWHKLFSPEQLTNFLIVSAVYLTFHYRDRFDPNRFSRLDLAVFGTLAVAASIKLNAVMFTPLIFGLYLSAHNWRDTVAVTGKAIFGGLLMISLFFLFNMPILISDEVRIDFLIGLNEQSNLTPNAGWMANEASRLRHVEQWLVSSNQGAVAKNFFPVLFLYVLLAIYLLTGAILALKQQWRRSMVSFIILLGAMAPVVFVFWSGRPYWHWYLTPSMIMLTLGLAWLPGLMEELERWVSSVYANVYYKTSAIGLMATGKIIAIVFASFIFLYHQVPVFLNNIEMRAQEDNSLDFRSAQIARHEALRVFSMRENRQKIEKSECDIGASNYAAFELRDLDDLGVTQSVTLKRINGRTVLNGWLSECRPLVVFLEYRYAHQRNGSDINEGAKFLADSGQYNIIYRSRHILLAARKDIRR